MFRRVIRRKGGALSTGLYCEGLSLARSMSASSRARSSMRRIGDERPDDRGIARDDLLEGREREQDQGEQLEGDDRFRLHQIGNEEHDAGEQQELEAMYGRFARLVDLVHLDLAADATSRARSRGRC